MAKYTPHTPRERAEMLAALGLTSLDGLHSDVPQALKIKSLDIPRGQTEFETERELAALAAKNRVYATVLAGGGIYDHIIPAALEKIVTRQEFLTAYTPYQPEMAQGILQAIFEYQTLMCRLTGHDVSNASVYDGATALAEAIAMCCEKKRKAVILGKINPQFETVAKTFADASGIELVFVREGADGLIDFAAAEKILTAGDVACVAAACPNYFGLVEDMERVGALAAEKGAKFIYIFDPMAVALLKTPAECGADIAVGEGQSYGLPMASGGATLGIMTAKKAHIRRLPGRIVGQTADAKGNRCFVLTLQAREQHIRREKASSSICSNQAHNALCAAVYLSLLGEKGLVDAANACAANAHYLALQLKTAGAELSYPKAEFFYEFVTNGGPKVRKALAKAGILGGVDLGGGRILWCATEAVTKAQMDVAALAAKAAFAAGKEAK